MTQTQGINDYEMMYYVLQADDVAFDLLVGKFERFMWKIIHNVCFDKQSYSFTLDDAYQEALHAFHDAIYYFRSELEVPFSAYMLTLVKNRILLLVRKQGSKSYQQLKYAVPYDSPMSVEEQIVLSEIISTPQMDNDPVYYANSESILKSATELSNQLDDLEQKVFRYRNAGYSYAQIGEFTQMSSKQVDNTLQKIRRQWKLLFDS